MENILLTFATTEGASDTKSDLFSSLGIDWQLLILQIIAFLVLLAILKKLVYPSLVAMLDKHDDSIRASADAAISAERHAAKAEEETAKLLDEAKQEANDIVTTAREEADQLISEAHKKAENQSETMIKTAKSEIEKEILEAKKALRNETLDLVVLASSKVLGEKIDTEKDQVLITKAIEEIKNG